MITQLTGQVVDIRPTAVTLDVGGVGFWLGCTPATVAGLRLNQTATVFTHLAVREDALTLYGFASPLEREAFVLVQSVSGIGPKLALAIVAHLSPDQLAQAISTQNLAALSGVPGVGKKTAERLVLELRDKATGLAGQSTPSAPSGLGWRDQVVTGLVGLGYSVKDAERAWEAVETSDDATGSVSAAMKAALRALAKR
ncbi:MAG: Holliday junction branch migration protein RuvA [Propionibacteriaceae bacterium]|jgi:Holliday junction DNA helicase RuvA|nr:Holliday junction branch migration protein RuvA [Propionibacteriaceae bacterium]